MIFTKWSHEILYNSTTNITITPYECEIKSIHIFFPKILLEKKTIFVHNLLLPNSLKKKIIKFLYLWTPHLQLDAMIITQKILKLLQL